MPSRVLKFSFVFMLILTLGMAFAVLRDYDGQTLTGCHYSLIVDGPLKRVEDSFKGLVSKLQSFSENHSVMIAKRDIGLDETQAARVVYVTSGSSLGREWLGEGYPSVNTDLTTVVKPIADVAVLDPRGIYLTTASRVQTEEIASIFQEAGLGVQVENERSVQRIVGFYFHSGPFAILIATIAVCSAIFLLGALILDLRRYTTQVLNGWSIGNIVASDGICIARVCLLWLLVLGAISFGGLVIFSGVTAATILVFLWLGMFIPGALLLLVLERVSLGIIFSDSIGTLLKGGVNSKYLVILLRGIQVLCICIAISLSNSLAAGVAQANSIARSNADWERFAHLAVVGLKTAQSVDGDMPVQVGSYGARELTSGRAVLALNSDPQASLGEVPSSFSGWKVLVVNDTYLRVSEMSKGWGVDEDSSDVQVLTPRGFLGTDSEN